jgi:hypothetical protein
VLLLWKNNIADFTVNVQKNSDTGHSDDSKDVEALLFDLRSDFPSKILGSCIIL